MNYLLRHLSILMTNLSVFCRKSKRRSRSRSRDKKERGEREKKRDRSGDRGGDRVGSRGGDRGRNRSRDRDRKHRSRSRDGKHGSGGGSGDGKHRSGSGSRSRERRRKRSLTPLLLPRRERWAHDENILKEFSIYLKRHLLNKLGTFFLTLRQENLKNLSSPYFILSLRSLRFYVFVFSRGSGGGKRKGLDRSPPALLGKPDELTPEERDMRTVFCMQLSQRIRARDLEEFFSSVGKVYF